MPLPLVALASQKSGMVLHFLCFYGHPTLSTWFTSEYRKSGKKLDMGKGCVRFKSLEDLALDVRFAGRERYGGRPRAVASWSRAAGATVLVKTGRPHRCARVRGGAHGQLPGGEGAHAQRKEGRQEVGGEEGEIKEVTLATRLPIHSVEPGAAVCLAHVRDRQRLPLRRAKCLQRA